MLVLLFLAKQKRQGQENKGEARHCEEGRTGPARGGELEAWSVFDLPDVYEDLYVMVLGRFVLIIDLVDVHGQIYRCCPARPHS